MFINNMWKIFKIMWLLKDGKLVFFGKERKVICFSMDRRIDFFSWLLMLINLEM